MFVIYGKDNCQFCERAKALLTQKGLEYTYLRMGVDYTREELLELVPDARTVPQIWVEDDVEFTKRVGGYTELEKFLQEGSEVTGLLEQGYTIRVAFTKADGSLREMLCTKNPELISERFIAEKKTDRTIKESTEVARVFDLEKNEWRSFRLDSIQSYEVAEVE